MADNVFKLWILRTDSLDRPLAIRFDVTDGRGMFVLPQSGVTTAPPASTGDEISGLSAVETRGTRFVHIASSTQRNVWALDTIPLEALQGLPADRWIELLCDPDGTTHLTEILPGIDLHTPETRRATSWQPPAKAPSNRKPPGHEGAPSLPETAGNTEQTAAERILELEQRLSRANQRVAHLKRRVASLERSVEQQGGTVQPWELDPRVHDRTDSES